MGSPEDPGQRQEIQLTFESIVESSEKWLGRLKKQEFRVRLASSFLTTFLVFAAVGGTILGVAVLQFGWGYVTDLFRHHPNQIALFAGIAFLAGIVGGIATYFILKRDHNARLRELSLLITDMKTENRTRGEGITGDALSLAEKIVTLLPELVRKRNQDSLLFGVAAFVLASTIANNSAVGVLVGVAVWLYFRRETKRTYEQEISKFEEQKRVFEQRKKDFIETL
ncbi:MAG: hypothetical protein OK457_03400 [Thaumarchaeota archaeon]|nr:hypothetical protein [Nitrososphaerota archaeon]